MANWQIEPFNKKRHVRTGFSSGKPKLDEFLHLQASQYDRRLLGKTYVVFHDPDMHIRGYYTLASSHVQPSVVQAALKVNLPNHPIPSLLLGRLAIDKRFHGQGLGKLLLFDALHQAVDLSRRVGLHFMEVQAIDQEASLFYQHYDFIPLDDPPRHLVLPIASLITSV
jgi:GNAT superfamily N-acetyltransferase